VVSRKNGIFSVGVCGDAFSFADFIEHHLRGVIKALPGDNLEFSELFFCFFSVCVHDRFFCCVLFLCWSRVGDVF